MTRRILRHDVPVDDQPHDIGGGDIVHVACRPDRVPRADRVEVWTVEDFADDLNDWPSKSRTVQVVGTGHAFPADWRPLGSALALDGALVWHVCEVP